MKRSKKIVLVSHCILNCNSKVEGCNVYEDTAKKLIAYLMDNDFGIIQLPCPEITMYGMKRWGHVKEQFYTAYFRKNCRSMFQPILEQIEDYIRNGYEIKAIIGINGSPSCGIERTCSSKLWGGEISRIKDFNKIREAINYVDESGVFMEEIKTILKERNIEIPMISMCKNDEECFNRIRKVI